MIIIRVQVTRLAGAFPHLAEGVLPQSAYFNQDFGNLESIRHVHVPVSIFLARMQALRRKGVDFRLYVVGGHGRNQRSHLCLLVLPVYMGAAALFITLAQQVGAQPQMGNHSFVGIILPELAEGNGLAYHDTVRTAAVPAHFTRQEGDARLTVDQGNSLEKQAVAPREIYRNHSSLRQPDNGGNIGIPRIIRHPLVGQGKTGSRSGGENAQHAALTQPRNHLPHSGKVLALGVLILVHVHLDQPGFQFLAQGKLFIGKNAHIVPDAGQQFPEHDAVRQAVGMVGDNNHRPFLGNVFQIAGPQLQLEVQMPGSQLEEVFRRTGLLVADDLVVRPVQTFQTKQLFSGRGHQGRETRIFVQNVFDIHHLRVLEPAHALLYNGFTGKSETLFPMPSGTQS